MSTTTHSFLSCEEHRLANGLRVVLHQDRSLPLVAVNVWYHVGSKNEKPGLTGFAHLFEHMLFQGSANVPDNDHFRQVQKVGGVANGSTWFDRTNYYETLPSNQLDLGLWLESDRMGFLLPAMTEEKLENQRSVVMNERRQRVDNQPYGRALERLNELLYPSDFPYHWPVIGYMEDIAAATLDDVSTFFQTYYTPNNAVLTLSGDFASQHALERVETWFGELPAGPEPPSVDTTLEPLGEVVRETLVDDVRLPRLYVAFRGPRYGEPSWYAGDLLAALLTDGKSSLLHRDLVHERELARDVSAYILPTEETATFTLTATGNPGCSISELEEEIIGHLDRIADHGPSEEQLTRAQNRVRSDLFVGLQTVDSRADMLAQHATYLGDPRIAATTPERYAAVTGTDIQNFARTVCQGSGRVAITVAPRTDS